VSGTGGTGASDTFTLDGGLYTVAWTATANPAWWNFSLFPVTPPNGATIEFEAVRIMPAPQTYHGTADRTGVPP